MIKNIDISTLKDWLDKDAVVLIDVREPAEHSSVHIKEAQLIPLNEICLTKLPELANKKLVIHCAGGMRSSNACKKLLRIASKITSAFWLIVYNFNLKQLAHK